MITKNTPCSSSISYHLQGWWYKRMVTKILNEAMSSFSLDCLYLDLSLKLCIYTILIRSSYESWANWKILSQSLISRFSTDQTKNWSGNNNCNWSKNLGGIKACKNFISWAELRFAVLNKIKRIKLYMTRLTLFMVCQHFKYEPDKYFSFKTDVFIFM